MSGRSVSGGVQGLRAMFEQGNSDTSPPSRGRSPGGSVTSDSSRPISKVRTSFVSVEGRGFSPLAVRKMSTGEGSVGADDTTTTTTKDNSTNIANGEAPKMNGNAGGQAKFDGDGAQHLAPNSTGQKEVQSADTPPANPDKPTRGVKEDPSNTLPTNSTDGDAVSGVAALKHDEEGLGSVLKGSPFQASSDPLAEQKVPSGGSISAGPSPTKSKSKEVSKVNGQPKTPGSATKEAAADPKTKTTTPRPHTLDTKKAPSSASRVQGPKSADKGSKSPQSPQTEKPTGAPTKQPSKMSSPRQTTQSKARSSNPTMEAEKAPSSSTRQTSLASKPSTTAAPKARQTSSTINEAPGRRGPASQTTKPQPKSPTRSVRLPASATAPTQASAAKHDELPSRSPSRASATHNPRPPLSTSSKVRPSISSTAGASSRPKPSRVSCYFRSLLAQSINSKTEYRLQAGRYQAYPSSVLYQETVSSLIL